MRRLEILPLDWGSSTSISTKDGKRQNGLAKTSGLKNAKRTKTLVDFLEEIDLEYTEQQPRRFLGKIRVVNGHGTHLLTIWTLT